jgi:hypothetical protein
MFKSQESYETKGIFKFQKSYEMERWFENLEMTRKPISSTISKAETVGFRFFKAVSALVVHVATHNASYTFHEVLAMVGIWQP